MYLEKERTNRTRQILQHYKNKRVKKLIQRKIGAEIEVPGSFISYDKEKTASQGETVGAIVPGIITEVHLEAPKNGSATLELATGLHGQYPAKDPLSLAFQVSYLSDWVEIARLRKKTYLKDMPLIKLSGNWKDVNNGNGPLIETDPGVKGAFQVNVSPTKGTASNLHELFSKVTTFEHNNGSLKAQIDPVNMALKNSKIFASALFDNLSKTLAFTIKSDLSSPVLSLLRSLVNIARISYFKYLRSQEGFTSSTYDIIDKNILDLLPRANLQELWLKTLKDDAHGVGINEVFQAALTKALKKTQFPFLKKGKVPGVKGNAAANKLLLSQFNELQNNRGDLSFEKWIQELEKLKKKIDSKELSGEIIEGPNIFHGDFIRHESFTNIVAVIDGKKVLIKDRSKKTDQPEAIMSSTDSSLLPVNREQGLAGVFEIRNPFNHMIPINDWGKAVSTYEKMLYQQGIRY